VEAHPATGAAKTGGESAIVARVGQKERTAKAGKAKMPKKRANHANPVTPKTAAMAEEAETTRHARRRSQRLVSPRSRGSPESPEKQKSHASHERQKNHASHEKGVRVVSRVADATVERARARANAANPVNHGPQQQ
jgi:hypothetical protein